MIEEILKIVNSIVGDAVIEENTNLISGELIDSMEILRIIVEIEKKYGIQFDMHSIDIKSFSSVVEITKLVGKMLEEKK